MDWHLPLVSLTSLKGARLALEDVIEHALSLASATPLQTPRHQRLRFATYPPVSTTLWEGRRLLETRTPARRGGQGVSGSGLARAGSIPPLPKPVHRCATEGLGPSWSGRFLRGPPMPHPPAPCRPLALRAPSRTSCPKERALRARPAPGAPPHPSRRARCAPPPPPA